MPPNEPEWKTRKKYIDPRHNAAGWRLTRYKSATTALRTEEEETTAGPAPRIGARGEARRRMGEKGADA
jgi:hypothetical protein